MILEPRARSPFEREVADVAEHALVVGPRLLRDVAVGKSRAVAEELRERDLTLAVPRELGNVIRDAVGERDRAFLDERPDAGRRVTTSCSKKQPQRAAAAACASRRASPNDSKRVRRVARRDLAPGFASAICSLIRPRSRRAERVNPSCQARD